MHIAKIYTFSLMSVLLALQGRLQALFYCCLIVPGFLVRLLPNLTAFSKSSILFLRYIHKD